MCCIPKILKNESNSQQRLNALDSLSSCVVSQRYWKMKAIHNHFFIWLIYHKVVLYPKDTEKWKQFTTLHQSFLQRFKLCCIPKILKNESNSQLSTWRFNEVKSCVVSQRYWKMKAIHNLSFSSVFFCVVVLYPKDTEKWKQFTTIYVAI